MKHETLNDRSPILVISKLLLERREISCALCKHPLQTIACQWRRPVDTHVSDSGDGRGPHLLAQRLNLGAQALTQRFDREELLVIRPSSSAVEVNGIGQLLREFVRRLRFGRTEVRRDNPDHLGARERARAPKQREQLEKLGVIAERLESGRAQSWNRTETLVEFEEEACDLIALRPSKERARDRLASVDDRSSSQLDS